MYEELKQEIINCRLCKSKFGFEPHPIVMGNANSKIMQISQAPSSNVHKTLKPFDDASGKKLRNVWYQIPDEVFYNPDNFYITSIAHCFPGTSPHGGDRLPPKSCAKKWLVREIEEVNNEIFIILGGKAASFFFPNEDLTALVFRDNYLSGKLTLVLPHPSPLNAKWFKDHPNFLSDRLIFVRKTIHKVLNL